MVHGKLEKVTINFTPVDLGRLEVLVAQGVFSSRSDAVRGAVRRLIEQHSDTISALVSAQGLRIGTLDLGRRELEEVVNSGGTFDGGVVGSLRIDSEVTPDLALRAISRLTVYGVAEIPSLVYEALGSDERVRIVGSVTLPPPGGEGA